MDGKLTGGRRWFFGLIGSGLAAGAVAPLVGEAKADDETQDEKRKARYQANSADVQTYYRVNRYPSP
jgi:hypothetical protein